MASSTQGIRSGRFLTRLIFWCVLPALLLSAFLAIHYLRSIAYPVSALTVITALALAIGLTLLIGIVGGRIASRRLARSFFNSTTPVRDADPSVAGAVAFDQEVTENQQSIKTLFESEQRLRITLDNLMEGCQIIDFDWRYRYLNKAVETHARRPEAELLGQRFTDMWPGVETTRVYREIERCMSKRVVVHMENEFAYPDGRKGWFDLRIQPVPEGVFILSVDISERKKAEEALRRSQKLLNEAQRISKVGGWEYDLAARKVSWTDEVYHIYGVSKDYDPSDPVKDIGFYAVQDQAKINEAFRRAVEHGEAYDLELQLIDAQGGRKWVRTMGQPHWEDGRIVRLSGNIVDITAQKLAEIERERLIAAIEQAGEAVLVTNPSGIIQYVNPAFEYMTGYAPSEAIGKTPRLLKSGKHAPAFYKTMWETITSGRTWKGRIINRRKDSMLYTASMTISPVTANNGEMVNFVGVIRDITEQLLLESQFQQSQKMETIGRLAGGVAHDYNNILSVIIGNTELSMDYAAPGEQLHENLSEILEAAHRSKAVTRQLLTFARKEAIAPEVLNINTCIQGLQKMLGRLIGEDIELIWLPGTDLWPVELDPSQVDQILANLCVNARDSITSVGRITIETANQTYDEAYCYHHPGCLPGDFVQLTVSDDGCGMSQETVNKIFEPFFTTKSPEKGTGLGLSTVFGIVQQNKGFIQVYSEPDAGTAFRINFPRHAGAAAEEKDQKMDAPPAGKGETVLLVEDEESILKLTERMLLRLGYRVWATSRPVEALELVKRHEGQLSLLITDVVMPGMNGRELVEQLTTILPKLKHLYMSGYTADVVSRSGILQAGDDYIQKPFTCLDLALKVRSLLDADGP